jgi:hypothetical protein
LWYAGGGTAIPLSAAAELPRVSAPVSHANLTVYFIHGPDTITSGKIATLQEALEAGWAVVHETGNWNQVMVENVSPEYEVFIQEGDMIRGGKQDRVIAVDMLLSPRSPKTPMPVHCVESGRSHQRGNEDATHFSKSDQFAVGNNVRYANATYQQGRVWEGVKTNQDQISTNLGVRVNAAESASSFQLALENKDLQAKVAEFEQALRAAGEANKDVIGVVFVLNGQVMGHEEYGSNALFQKAWPKLLRSAAADAVVEKAKRPITSVPSVGDIETYLARGPGEATRNAADAGGSPLGDVTLEELTNHDVGLAATVAHRTHAEIRQAMAREQDQLEALQAQIEVYAVTNVRSTPDETAQRRQVAAQIRARSGQVTPTVFTADGTVVGGSGAAVLVNTEHLRQLVGDWRNLGQAERDRRTAELLQEFPAQQRPMVESFVAQAASAWFPSPAVPREPNAAPNPAGNVQQAVMASRGGTVLSGGGVAPAGALPANVQGSRLNVNRVDTGTGLTSEARDPARQNAIIHKSSIKVPEGAAPKTRPVVLTTDW